MFKSKEQYQKYISETKSDQVGLPGCLSFLLILARGEIKTRLAKRHVAAGGNVEVTGYYYVRRGSGIYSVCFFRKGTQASATPKVGQTWRLVESDQQDILDTIFD